MDIQLTNCEALSKIMQQISDEENIAMYVTETSLEDEETLYEEAAVIIDNIDDYYSGFTSTFNSFLVSAFNEMPSDPQKYYNYYTTIIQL